MNNLFCPVRISTELLIQKSRTCFFLASKFYSLRRLTILIVRNWTSNISANLVFFEWRFFVFLVFFVFYNIEQRSASVFSLKFLCLTLIKNKPLFCILYEKIITNRSHCQWCMSRMYAKSSMKRSKRYFKRCSRL